MAAAVEGRSCSPGRRRRSSSSGSTSSGGRAVVAALAALLALSTAPVKVACQAVLPETLDEAIEASFFLNSFRAAAEASGYEDALYDPDFKGTIFAPVDLAFESVLKAMNTTLPQLVSKPSGGANASVLADVVKFHIVPGVSHFPLASLRSGMRLKTAQGADLIVDRSVPGYIHIYGDEPRGRLVPTQNFATVLQYQELKSKKAVLYAIDRVLAPPTEPPTPKVTANSRRRSRNTSG